MMAELVIKRALTTLIFTLTAFWMVAAFAATADAPSAEVGAVVKQLQSSGRYMEVRVLWRRRPGEPGPAAIVAGIWGGSAGLIDLYAPFGARSDQVRVLSLPMADGLSVRTTRRGPAFDAPFVVSRFNGAPNSSSSIAPLPIVWSADDFQLELSALLGRTFSPADLRFRRLAASYELNAWDHALNSPAVLYPAASEPPGFIGTPVTVQALMDLMLTGHADEARRVLDASWPSVPERLDVKSSGEQRFWHDLSQAFRRNPLWKRFDLDRLPQARLIDAGGD